MITGNRLIITSDEVNIHFFTKNSGFAKLMETNQRFIRTLFFMFGQIAVFHKVCTPLLLKLAVELQRFELALEGNGCLHHFNTLASERANALECPYVTLPAVNALEAENIPAFRTFSWVFEQVLAHLASKVNSFVGVKIRHSFKQSLLL